MTMCMACGKRRPGCDCPKSAPKVEVFKVQRDMTGGYLLIYNRDASSMQQVPWKQVKNLLGIHGMRPMTKRFVYAEVSDTHIHVTGPAPSQDW